LPFASTFSCTTEPPSPTRNRGMAFAWLALQETGSMNIRTALLALSGAAALLAAASIGVPSSFDAMDEAVAFAIRAAN
jgi:hypothetical protein